MYKKSKMERLPKEIILYILSFSYNVQSQEILEDIRNYHETKKTIFDLYHKTWILDIGEKEPEDKIWLINDLFTYSNNYEALMYGYITQFYTMFYRNRFLHTKYQINKYIEKLEKQPLHTQINVFWALFTQYERNEFIEHRRIVDNIS